MFDDESSLSKTRIMITNNKTLLLFFVLMTCCAILYYPSLSGGYMLDDENSLSKLSIIDDELTFENLKGYLGQSKTGVLYRPIPVFSFLLDGTHWPIDPYSFKRTNLIIHIFNGTILLLLLLIIFKKSQTYRSDATFITFVCVSFWLLHPFLVSTVMYIVQRMVLLSASFILLGLLFYTIGRVRYEEKSDKKSLIYLFFGMYLMSGLSVLCKENGALLVYFIVLLELFVFRKFLNFEPLTKKVKFFILYLPAALLSVVLLLKLPSFLQPYDYRLFSLEERLYTQLRAISTYLYHIFIPKYFTEGVYTDGFALSKSLFDPLTTLASLIFIVGLFYLAWLYRNSKPLISFAILFFFTAHLIESTIIPLELYFEHRNYIPMFFVFIPLTLFLNWLRKKSKIALIICTSLVLFVAFNTYLRTNLWGDNFKLHYQTMNKYPESTRARVLTMIEYEKRGEIATVFQLLEDGIELNNQLDLRINQLSMLCTYKQLKDEYVDVLYTHSLKYKLSRNDIVSYGHLVYEMLDSNCGEGSSINSAQKLISILEDNSFESNKERKPFTYFFKSKLSFVKKDYLEAKELFIETFKANHDYINLFLIIEDFIKLGKTEYARELLGMGLKAYKEDYRFSIDWFNFDRVFDELEEKLHSIESSAS